MANHRRFNAQEVFIILGCSLSCQTLARHFGVSPNTIWVIRQGITYKDLFRRFQELDW